MDEIESTIVDNIKPPKSLTLKTLREFAKDRGILIGKLNTKKDIYQKIRYTLIYRVDGSKLSELTLENLKNLARDLGLPQNGKKVDIINRIIQYDFIEKNGDVLSLYKMLKYKVGTTGKIEKLLVQLQDLPYVDCSWLNKLDLSKIGSGEGGIVYKDEQGNTYKIISYLEYSSYITVIFAEYVNKLLYTKPNDNSETMIMTFRIEKCLEIEEFTNENKIIEIQEYVDGIKYEDFMEDFSDYQNNEKYMEIVKSVLAQIIITILWLISNKIFHLDLHSENIMVYETSQEYFTLTIDHYKYKVPTFGYSIKIIDYDYVAIVINNKLYMSDFPPYVGIDRLSSDLVENYPIYGMIVMFTRFFNDMSTPYYLVKDNNITNFIEGFEKGEPNRFLPKGIFNRGYSKSNYDKVYRILKKEINKIIRDLI